MIEAAYTQARQNLASLLKQVTDDREIVLINHLGNAKVAMIAEEALASLLESVHLLKSPKNAQRFYEAMAALENGQGQVLTVEELRQESGLSE
jgi:antitoxin YefM